ncbi:MAG: BamA/TamA family outer membrane protein [Turneriella sp.]|nr:BamA/TamA family outer membrane protein [Turneriella sp.]
MLLNPFKNLWPAFALALLATVPLATQDAPAAVNTEVKKEETWGMFPLLVPLYSPETRFMVAGGGIFWYNPWPEAPRKRISELTTFFTASQNKQYSMGLIFEAYFFRHRLKVMQNLDAYKQPNLFWGIGPTTSNSNEEKFNPTGFANRTSFLWLIAEDVYLGGLWQSQFDSISAESDTGYLSTLKPAGYAGTKINGPGIHLLVDTRDNAFSPERGHWFEARMVYSSQGLGADGNLLQTTFDYRWFKKIWFGHIFALNALLTTTLGDAQWYAMPRLGGQFQMRGFYYGRYLDRHLWVAQADYRLPVWWRFGLVLFTGVGDVTGDLLAPFSSNFKISYGSGVRILVDKEQKINMRLDLGFTNQGDVNFYFTFKEAF